MNEREFLTNFEQSSNRDRLVNNVYAVFTHHCVKNDITEDELSSATVEQLAEGFVERGLGVPKSDTTLAEDTKWTEELGEATDGDL
jgi:hypothetical protein